MLSGNNKQAARSLWIIFLTIFIDMLGIGILIPVFPLLIIKSSEFNVIPANWTSAQGLIMAGWLLAIYPLAQFVFTPILGQLSDRYGRRKLLIISICGTACSYLLFAYAIYARNIPLMFISRLLDGATGGNISIAQAVIGDVSDTKARARNFGMVGVAIGIGFVFGPFIGGKLSDPHLVSWFGAAIPFEFTALLGFINVALILILLPETLPVVNRRPVIYAKAVKNILRLSGSVKLRKLVYSVFLFNAGFTFFTTFWGVILQEQFGFKQGQVGNFFAYSGIMIILAQGLFVRRLSGKVADYKVIPLALLGVAICIWVNYLIPVSLPYLIYYVPPFVAIFVALTKSFSSAMIVRISAKAALGEAMGINSSATALAQALPAIASGYLASDYARLPVLVGAIAAFIGALVFIMNLREFR